jgi:hypothetical protein
MVDSGCLTYGLISSKVVSRFRLERIPISPRPIAGWDGQESNSSSELARMTLDIGGQAIEAYLFIVPVLDFDLILGLPWMKA